MCKPRKYRTILTEEDNYVTGGQIIKKYIICLILIFVSCTSIFALKNEVWFSFGVPVGNHFENGDGINDMYLCSLGGKIGIYNFINSRKIGFFVNASFFLPIHNNLEDGYEPGIHYNLIIGPVFRHNINHNINLYFGLGLDLQWFSLFKTDNNIKFYDYRSAYGISGDIGIKYDITDIIYFSIGVGLSYYFANNMTLESTTDNWKTTIRESDGWIRRYSMFGINPYIAIGFNYYGENSGRWGKPKH